tara:strand:- start:2 stop:211 length:210 start_codon:yes stop_codon:yes gene_type:complete
MSSQQQCKCNPEPTIIDIRLECLRLVFESGTDYQKKQWDSMAAEMVAWITRVDAKRSSKTAGKKADQKS